MIFDRLSNSGTYFKNCAIAKGLDFIKIFDQSKADGKYEIQGTDIYALVMSYNTRDAESGQFETHEKYIDIQYLISGSERLDVAVVDSSFKIASAYDSSKDIAFYNDPNVYSKLALEPGVFAVLYPQDAHKPCINLNSKSAVRKIVVKVKVG